MKNPYQSPDRIDDSTSGGTGKRVVARAAVVFLHFLILAFFFYLGGPFLKRTFNLDLNNEGIAKFGLTDFNSFVLRFGFIAVFFILLFDVVAWIVLLRGSARPLRWKWLAVTTIAIPLITVLVWLAFGPMVRSTYWPAAN